MILTEIQAFDVARRFQNLRKYEENRLIKLLGKHLPLSLDTV